MWKFFLGPILFAAAYVAGSIYGADAEQLVRKPPAEVRDAVAQSINGAPQEGTMQLQGGRPVPYSVTLDDPADGEMVVHLAFDGRQGAETRLAFAPADGGADTLITAHVHADRAVLRDALAGTAKAKLALAPDWLFNIALRQVLGQLAGQIERGEVISDPTGGYVSQAEWESSLPPDQQKQVQEWRQYDATRPAVDPDADAQNYMSGGAKQP